MKLNDYRQMMAYMRRPGFQDGTMVPPQKPEQKTPFIDKLKNLKEVAPGLMPRSKVSILKMYMDEALRDGEITQEQHTEMLMPYFGELGENVTEQIEVSDRDNFAIGGGQFEGTDLGTREGFAKIELNAEFQKQVKDLLDQGLSNNEVAEKLNRGVTTIKRVKEAIKYPSKKEAIADETTRRYTKLKELVEEANKGSKLIYQKDLAKSVGIKSLDPNFAKMKKRFNVPDLDTPADKVQKEFLKIIKNPETPIEDTFSLVKKISEKTGVGSSKASEHLLKLPEYKDANKMLKTLSQVEFQKKIQGKGFTLGDFEEIIDQKIKSPKLQVSSISTPEKFIIDSAIRHQSVGGNKIKFIKKPGDIDREGNVISHKDAEFEYKNKRYSYFDLLKDGRKNKEFKDVYKVADDLNEFLGKEVTHPVTKQKIIFKDLMKEAYNKGAGYGYERAPYDIDHFKSVKKEPFKNLRVLPRRINTSQGIMMNLADTAQKGFLAEETASKYTPEKTKAYSKKMGYDFNKNIDQLFKDELKLADDILVKGRVLKTPLDIAKKSFVDSPKLQARIPGLSDLFEMAKDIPGDLKRAKYLSAGLKTLGVAATPLVAYDTYKAFKEGKPIAEALEQGFIGTDLIGSTKDLMALSPEGREARSVVKQGEMREQITDDFSSLDTDFDTPNVKSEMSRAEAERKWENEKVAIGKKRAAEEKNMANARAISIEGLKNLIMGNRFQPAEMPTQAMAKGGIMRLGFADGPDDPSKRKFIKLGAGLMSLPIIGKYLKFAAPVAEKSVEIIRRGADGVPDFILDLIAKVKLKAAEKGTKYFTGNRSDEFADVYQADDFVVTQQGNKTTVKKRNQEGDMLEKDMEMEIDTDPETGGITYNEATARPDAEGKLKDIEEFIDDADLEDMRKYTYDD